MRVLLRFAIATVVLAKRHEEGAMSKRAAPQAQTGRVRVNELEMYYEIHGTGEPLLLLHGQFATIAMFFKILPELAATRPPFST
jgi:hypothetical protein